MDGWPKMIALEYLRRKTGSDITMEAQEIEIECFMMTGMVWEGVSNVLSSPGCVFGSAVRFGCFRLLAPARLTYILC